MEIRELSIILWVSSILTLVVVILLYETFRDRYKEYR